MTALTVTFSISAYPDGAQVTPAQFVALMFEAPNGIITAQVTGDFPAGKIGGSVPTEDLGTYFSQDKADMTIQGWIEAEGKYVRYGVTPVGAILSYIGAVSVEAEANPSTGCPTNWLFLNGGRAAIADYPDLYDIIGRQWDYEGDDALGDYDTQFRLPNACGRLIVGAGTGQLTPGGATGDLRDRGVAAYVGNNHPFNMNTIPNAPASRSRFSSTTVVNIATSIMIENMPCAISFNWMVRAR